MATGTDNGLARIAKLNNSNYQTWKFKVELLLTKDDLWDAISKATPNPITDKWQTKDQKARATIGLLLEDNQLNLIRKQTTAKGTWMALQAYHEKSTLSNKVSLLRKLCALKLTETGSMEDHLRQMEDIIDRLASLGEALAEQLTVALFLSSLPESYSTLITALETRPEEDLTQELVKNKLLEEYRRRTENASVYSEADDQKALKTESFKSKEQYERNRQSYKITCFFCKKPNHVKKECKKYMEWKKKHPDHKVKAVCEEASNKSKDQEDDEDPSFSCFSVEQECINKIDCNWYIDSGATSHMCSDKSLFKNINETYRSQVKLANGHKLQTKGIGDIMLRGNSENEDGTVSNIKLLNVLYVPELIGHLISVKTLTSKGYEVIFRGDKCLIMRENRMITAATERQGLYELCLWTSEQKEKHCIHVWHNRLGHRNPDIIRKMEKQVTAEGFSLCQCAVKKACECCIKAKMVRKPFPKEASSSSVQLLDLIHTDVCGPMQTVTPGNKKYYMTMIDDHSRYTKVYLLNQKSEVTAKVKEYVNHVKTQFGKIPKKIRSDRGGEYVNKELQEYIKSEGIEVELTCPYSPQQNGTAERKNRYLTEMTRCMLTNAVLPNKYWGEAIMTANYLQNRMPAAGDMMSPFEKWSGKKPQLSHVRQFGAKAFVLIPNVKRQKLDSKARELMLVGYEEGTKGYRLLDVKTDKICVSRDVKFIENDPHVTGNGQLSSTETVTNTERAIDIDEGSNEVASLHDQNDTVEMPVQEERNETANQGQLLKRPERANRGKAPERLIEIINKVTTEHNDPRSYKEAVNSQDAQHWINAMNEEIESFKANETWSLTELPKEKTAVGSKWVYKTKTDENGNIVRYKARLVAQGFAQKYGSDYDEVFAPVVRPTTLRLLLTIAGHQKMTVKHYDIQSAYLNGKLSHEVYMKQPEGYITTSDHLVYKLNKNVYGLKQGANEWNKKLNTILTDAGYNRSLNDPCLYVKQKNGHYVYILVYVDDLIAAATSSQMFADFECVMNCVVVMKDLGNLHYYIGLQFERDNDGFFKVCQKKYIEEKLIEFRLDESKESNIPIDTGYLKIDTTENEKANKEIFRKAIGSLQYLATNTRPDICIAVSILARRVENPKQSDWTEVKRVFRYLKKTKDKKLILGQKQDSTELVCYADADWGNDPADRKSNTGYCFKFMGSVVYWKSHKQTMVTLSSTEAEYISLAEAAQEAIWMTRILKDLNQIVNTVVMYEDNQSCIHMLKNGNNLRTKHIDTKYHFVRELVKTKAISVEYCPTENMIADMLTKPLEAVRLNKLTVAMGLQ
jgi:hypothetical protein